MSVELHALNATIKGHPDIIVYPPRRVALADVVMPWSVTIGDIRLWVEDRAVLADLRDTLESVLAQNPEETS